MSNQEPFNQLSTSSDCPRAEGVREIQRITARTAQVGGGIAINRLMPSRQRRTIGAWCFLDHAGPTVFESNAGLRVGPHPHIGLQTFTWMIKGEVLHRDSLGNEQVVRPGQVNLMTAGRGITHTEESLAQEHHLHAAQLWIALPQADKDCAPAFDHYPDLPTWAEGGLQLTLLAGGFAGRTAPGRFYSPLVGIDLRCDAAASVHLSLDPQFEYGILPLEGAFSINGQTFASNELAYLGRGLSELSLQSFAASRALLLGGVPLTEEIYLWWNFVAHDKADIVEALLAWNNRDLQRFGDVEGFDGDRLLAPELPWPHA
ncbi:pirin family protein [Pseudomonas sp. WS 5059]|uniref:pirin family protein n=1 Tax=unclassified Pseudomonas TaxID=196821 RepID=UPI001473491F|nr:pirin family protein [Pseudomonas sp. WS 5059]NMY02189.1 pirin family protein [Pseudomonas sp. WS 5059]